MANWDLLLTDVNLATLREGGTPYGITENAALAISDGKIAWLGPAAEARAQAADDVVSLQGRWLTPALIDCHTHLVFAGNRASEFELRRRGASYEEIARAGGGIMSTVNATRLTSTDALLQQSMQRLVTLRQEGVATVEIKSGYGLATDAEARMLEVAALLAEQCGVTVRRTFLGAHAVPADFKGRADDYIDLVCNEMLPQIAAASLADAVDAYCESIAFSTDQVARVFERAGELGLPVKLHADQLSDCGGAELAAAFAALSADHIEYTGVAGVQAMAKSGAVAVLLPGAFVTLGETVKPPVAALRNHGVPIAVASDCNPGTSPVCSIRAAMSLAGSVFGLTPEECLAGATREAARALGLLHDRGTLELGKRADIAVWDIGHPRELSYWMGLHRPEQLLVNGLPLALS